MLLFENIMLALAGLKANKSRALLTMLGIIIGIGSVIAITTVGSSMNQSITSSMESMGVNNITVGLQQKSTKTETTEGGMSFSTSPRSSSLKEEDYITPDMLEDLETEYSDKIAGFSISETIGSGTAEDIKLYANVSIVGVNDTYLEQLELTYLSGRSFTTRDYEQNKKVAIVSEQLVEKMFDGNSQDAIGNTVDIMVNNRYYTYTVIGVYEKQEDSSSMFSTSTEEASTQVYIPIGTAFLQNHTNERYQQFTIISNTGVDTASFLTQVETYMNRRFYHSNESYQVSAYSMESMVSSMTEMLSTISLAIAIIAGISLLVGGIGVMNIMLVSITERTREIGTRKALGATNGSIRLQFIMESIVICLLGGIVGIVVGISLGSAAVTYMGYEASPSVTSIMVAVLFSGFIGIFFGYYPANRAAKLNPIDALRYE